LLSPVYSIDPRSTEFAIKRGMKLVGMLTSINEHLAASTMPVRPPLTSGDGVQGFFPPRAILGARGWSI
jgi:hypothetical protein